MLISTRADPVSRLSSNYAWRHACTVPVEHYGGRTMTRVWTGATLAIALGCAATLAAQQTSSSQTSQTAGSSSSRTITVTGCLQKGESSSPGATGTTGTAGATASASSANQWM